MHMTAERIEQDWGKGSNCVDAGWIFDPDKEPMFADISLTRNMKSRTTCCR